MAAEAVLLTHMDTTAVIAPKPAITRIGLPLIHGMERNTTATRRSSRWSIIARASMKLPMNRNTMGSAKGASTLLASATPSKIHSVGPRIAVTGSGTVSVIHSTATATSTAATLRPVGVNVWAVSVQVMKKPSGANRAPLPLRQRSNRASAAEIVSSVAVSASKGNWLIDHLACCRASAAVNARS